MNQQNQSPLDNAPYFEVVRELILNGAMNATVVSVLARDWQLETSTDSVRRFRQRHGLQKIGQQPSYTRINGDDAEALCDVTDQPVLDDPDTMLSQRGLNPEDWYIDSISGTDWEAPRKGGDKVRLYRTKFTAKRKHPELVLQPVRSDGWIRPKMARVKLAIDKPDLVVICGDQQAPHHDLQLNELFCRWLVKNQPHRGINLGDLIDFGDISRHPSDPENVAAAQEGLQAGYDITRGYVEASPTTEWEFIPGNHDERIRAYLLKYAPYLYGISRVNTLESVGEPVLGLPHLLRLDELGVKFIEPYGPYEDAQIELSKYLAVRHGWVVRQGSGASALKTLEQTGYSILIGHTHRQSIVQHTVHDIDRKSKTLLAAEVGCMCRIDSGRDTDNRRFPSYTVLPDWQQGFATATLWSDQTFKIDLASYVLSKGTPTLLWRDQKYTL